MTINRVILLFLTPLLVAMQFAATDSAWANDRVWTMEELMPGVREELVEKKFKTQELKIDGHRYRGPYYWLDNNRILLQRWVKDDEFGPGKKQRGLYLWTVGKGTEYYSPVFEPTYSSKSGAQRYCSVGGKVFRIVELRRKTLIYAYGPVGKEKQYLEKVFEPLTNPNSKRVFDRRKCKFVNRTEILLEGELSGLNGKSGFYEVKEILKDKRITVFKNGKKNTVSTFDFSKYQIDKKLKIFPRYYSKWSGAYIFAERKYRRKNYQPNKGIEHVFLLKNLRKINAFEIPLWGHYIPKGNFMGAFHYTRIGLFVIDSKIYESFRDYPKIGQYLPRFFCRKDGLCYITGTSITPPAFGGGDVSPDGCRLVFGGYARNYFPDGQVEGDYRTFVVDVCDDEMDTLGANSSNEKSGGG